MTYCNDLLEISLGSLTESFIKIQQKEAYQDSTYPHNLLLESWRTWKFLMVLELVWDVLDLAGDGAKVLKILQGSLLFKSLPGVLKDMDVHDEAGDGVMVLKISQGNFIESFIKIQHQEACQDSSYPPSLFLESWRTEMFLI